MALKVKVRDTSSKVNYLSKVIYNRVYQVYQFHHNRLASPFDGSVQRKTPLAGELIERTSSMLDEIASKMVH